MRLVDLPRFTGIQPSRKTFTLYIHRSCQSTTGGAQTATPAVEDEEDVERGHGVPDRPEAVLESPALARTFFLGALGGFLFPLLPFLVGLRVKPTHCRKRASLFSMIVNRPLGLIIVSIPCATWSSASSSEHAIGTSNGEAPVMLGEIEGAAPATECFAEDAAPS